RPAPRCSSQCGGRSLNGPANPGPRLECTGSRKPPLLAIATVFLPGRAWGNSFLHASPARYLAEMPLRFVAVSFGVRDPGGVAAFWSGMLGRETIAEPDGALVPGTDTQVGLRFMAADTEVETGPNRLHLHLTSSDLDDQQESVDKAI